MTGKLIYITTTFYYKTFLTRLLMNLSRETLAWYDKRITNVLESGFCDISRRRDVDVPPDQSIRSLFFSRVLISPETRILIRTAWPALWNSIQNYETQSPSSGPVATEDIMDGCGGALLVLSAFGPRELWFRWSKLWSRVAPMMTESFPERVASECSSLFPSITRASFPRPFFCFFFLRYHSLFSTASL